MTVATITKATTTLAMVQDITTKTAGTAAAAAVNVAAELARLLGLAHFAQYHEW